MKTTIQIILIILILVIQVFIMKFLYTQNENIKDLSYGVNDIARQLEIDLNY